MKFQSINLVTIVILMLAISLSGCDHSRLHTQPNFSSQTTSFIGVWQLIPDHNITDSAHRLEFKSNTLTEIISNSDQTESCLDKPLLYKEYEWSTTQHDNQLKLVTTIHMECGSEITAGAEHMVSYRLEDDVLHIFNKRWERAIFTVD